MRATRLGAVLLLAPGLAACGGLRIAREPIPEGMLWPAQRPRVELVGVVAVQKRPGKLFSLLGGVQQTSLFERPYGLTWQGEALVVADPAARRLVRIAASGVVEASSTGEVGAPVGVAACARGLVASDSIGGRLALLGPDLRRRRWLAEGLLRPSGVACLGDTIFVVETGRHQILALEPDGSRRRLGRRGDGPGEFNFPAALVATNGGLLVGDTLNFRVQEIDAGSGAFRRSFGRLGDASGEMPRIKGLAQDAEGQIWVSDAHTDSVSLYTGEGRLLMSLGGRGDLPGRFSFPAALAAGPDRKVAVADSLNARIQVFRLVSPEERLP